MLPARELNPGFLASVGRRAHRLLVTTGFASPKPTKRRYSRSELRQIESIAHRALEQAKHGACAQLARDMVDIAVSVDNAWVEMFPVFEMIDEMVRKEHCILQADSKGYRLVDAKGETVSQGETLRLLLLNHVLLYGVPVTEDYSREDE